MYGKTPQSNCSGNDGDFDCISVVGNAFGNGFAQFEQDSYCLCYAFVVVVVAVVIE